MTRAGPQRGWPKSAEIGGRIKPKRVAEINRNRWPKWPEYATYSQYFSSGAYLSAYVVAFSIFEDRVTAAFMLAKDNAKLKRPRSFTRLKAKLDFLMEQGVLPEHEHAKWLSAANERNSNLHAAMWAPDAITKINCSGILALARAADKIARTLK